MASTSQTNRVKDSLQFSSVLASAVCEWLLMLLLFLNALFSYLITVLARLFKLQTPCLLCSRLDHIFGNEKPGFYMDLFCDTHKSELSSLLYCRVHQKLADSDHMCDACLFSLTLDKKPGRGSDICSCCSVLVRRKSHSDSLLQISPIGVDVSKEFLYQSPKLETEKAIPNNLARSLSDEAEVEKMVHPSIEFNSSSLLPDNHLLGIHGDSDAAPATIEQENEEAQDINSRTVSETTRSQTHRTSSELSNGKVELPSTTSADDHSKPLISEADPSLPGSTPFDLNDAYKIAIGSKTRLPSPTISEVITGRDSFKVYEDLKLLVSQFSASRGLESPWNDLSPSPRVLGHDLTDASSSAILHNISQSLSIERNESGFESLDGSLVNEIEGESPVDRLKRQVELDRKSIYLLYKELEEERNASAIAANQAMAMINKLQEEKAVMQMEALHYQRLVEEQAEYDQEALQISNGLLSQRETEIRNLEEEVRRYRERSGDKADEATV